MHRMEIKLKDKSIVKLLKVNLSTGQSRISQKQAMIKISFQKFIYKSFKPEEILVN